jgi:hypothetical protein
VGSCDSFDRSLALFGETYADQNEEGCAALKQAGD